MTRPVLSRSRFRLGGLLLLAKAYAALSWPGVLGACALTVAGAIWYARPMLPAPTMPLPAERLALSKKGSGPDRSVSLSKPEDIALIQTQLEVAANAEGLPWTEGHYRLMPAGLDPFPSLDVQTTLKGPYPRVRSYIGDVLRDVPGATLAGLSISRPSSDSADVEAKLTVTVFLEGPVEGLGRGSVAATGGKR